MKWISSAVLTIAAAGMVASTANALTSTRVLTGLDRPTFVTAPAGDDRLFVLEQPGRIRVFEADGTPLGVFLDINTEVAFDGGNDERGLLGLAFSPDYGTDGLFYVNFTNTSGTTNVRRYQVSADPDVADDSTFDTVITVGQPFENHNGGRMEFGPDGYLYIGLGDGGSSNDPGQRAQNINELLGKILRLDVSGGMGTTYTNPPTNPFVGVAGLDEIWAYGIRNPWGVSFDTMTGDLYIADVGQFAWEEINVQPAASTGGENYGWRITEGNHCNIPNPCDMTGHTLPVHEYSHSGGRCSVTGGYVYRGTELTGVSGHYFFGEWCSDQIWSFQWDGGGGVTNFVDRTAELVPDVGTIINISSVGTDGHGELYIVDRGSAFSATGELFKIIDTAVDVDDVAVSPKSHLFAAPNPFTNETRVSLGFADDTEYVNVSIVDVQGRVVRQLASGVIGSGQVVWDGRDDSNVAVSAGVYFLQVETLDGRVSRSRVTLVR